MKVHIPELGIVADELRAARERLDDPRARPLAVVVHRAPQLEYALLVIGFALVAIAIALNFPPGSKVAGRRHHA